ncbi:hypothetical protein ISG27_12695 [Burkholderia pseudomallei]|nr:hypothetical protein [Burkholderia pseudomallei]MBF3975028.1 hypothetical protein [Burkholderia pseudomallei]
MMKARAGNAIIIGLSRLNIEKLMHDLPIKFEGDELGVPGKTFYILFGETEQEIYDLLTRAGFESSKPEH